MKIGVCSDLHLEFGTLELTNPGDVDVLILSGDILVENDLGVWDRRQAELGFMTKRSQLFHEFMQRCSEQFKTVVYIAGNHEHYHGDFAVTLSELKRKFAYLKNVNVLDKESIVVDGVRFFGGTLWTDMNKRDPLTLYQITRKMNDFRIIKNTNRVVNYRATVNLDKPVGMTDDEWIAMPVEKRTKTEFKERTSTFSPEDAVEEHEKFLATLTEVYDSSEEPLVVVGHHTPSMQSCDPVYRSDVVMNGGYHSSLEEFILDHPRIKLWTHGHTHDYYDYEIGETRVVCNPRGYVGHEYIADNFTLKVVEV
jgi:Icc-related predicted phosphoesterase